jgi:hypothetical protein
MEHYMNEEAYDWAIFITDKKEARGIKSCGGLNIVDIDNKIEEIESKNFIRYIDDVNHDKNILKNTEKFFGNFQGNLFTFRDINKNGNQPEGVIWNTSLGW